MRRTPDAQGPAALPSAGAKWQGLRWSWADATGKADGFAPSRAEERRYARQLKSVAGRVRQIAAGTGDPAEKAAQLRRYAETIRPWAEQAAAGMLAGVERKNAKVWERQAKAMGAGLRIRLGEAVNGVTLRQLISGNASLITSLASDAADKIAHYTAEALTSGMRADALAKKIQGVGGVAEHRARTIARTEVSKASSALTRQRAQSVGSTGYIWRTARDGGVRDSHGRMEGQFVPWDKPPTLDGMTGHAGEVPNCRCYPEPVIPMSGKANAGNDFPSPLPVAEEMEAAPAKGLLSRWEQDNVEIVRHEDGHPLPGFGGASISPRKLAAYVLDPDHAKGKGRLMRAALGMDARHADDLREQIMARLPEVAARRVAAAKGAVSTDQYGERFRAVVPVTGPNGRTVDVVTAWIYDRGRGRQSEAPRLVSAFLAGPAPKKT